MPSYTIKIKKTPNLILPRKADDLSSGYDIGAISAPEIVGEEIQPGVYRRIDYIQYRTGLFFDPTDSFYDLDEDENGRVEVEYDTRLHILIFPRSSISKYNLILANSIGLCDNSYRGEVLVRFKYIYQPEDVVFLDPNKHPSFGIRINFDKIYKSGDRIAQLIFQEVPPDIKFSIVDELDSTTRASGGFGSSGV